ASTEIPGRPRLFFFSSRRRHTRSKRDWSSDVCSSDLRGEVPQASPELLVVVRAMERSAVADPRGTAADPRRDAARLRAALTALPTVRDQLLADPEQELRLRLAQALEGAGDHPAATTAALDALELMDDRA